MLGLAPALAQPPSRIASLGLCTDQLLLHTANLEQVVSVSRLSTNPNSATYLLTKEQANAHAIYINQGAVEELIPLKPDLVITSNYTAPAAARLLKRLGYRLESFPSPTSLSQLRENIRRMGEITGNVARATSELKELASTLNKYRLTDSSPRMLIYGANSYVNGPKTLSGDLFRELGWHNVATEAGVETYGQINLEQLAALPLDTLVLSEFSRDKGFSQAESAITHRLLNQLPIRDRATIESRWWLCGTGAIRHAIPLIPQPTAKNSP